MTKKQMTDVICGLQEEMGQQQGAGAGVINAPTGQRILDKLDDIVSRLDKFDKRQDAFAARLSAMEDKFSTLTKTVENQQLFIEQLDGKNRANNIIMTGIPADSDCAGASDDAGKVRNILSQIGVQVTPTSYKRLGDVRTSPRAPILVVLPGPDKRKDVLDNAAKLANTPDLSSIRIKKDRHPAVRREWTRLWKVEQAEKQKPENAGAVISFDRKERKLYRDGIVIDAWKPSFL